MNELQLDIVGFDLHGMRHTARDVRYTIDGGKAKVTKYGSIRPSSGAPFDATGSDFIRGKIGNAINAHRKHG
jgi:hypothetical protein